MAVECLHAKNFKGIADLSEFPLAPLTIFLGPNSSGKSSVIHALAALAQTVKLGDISRRLVLDDEFAQVHLGRFIEIIHSKRYQDSIELGLSLGRRRVPLHIKKATHLEGEIQAKYVFRSTLRTQEVFVFSAELSLGGRTITFARHGSGYKVKDSASGRTFSASVTTNFFFEIEWLRPSDEQWYEVMQVVRTIQLWVGDELRQTLYLGPFRQSPRRRYPFRGSIPLEVGAQGENAISMLAAEHLTSKSRPHTTQIAKWLSQLNLANKVQVARVGSSDLFDLNLTLPDSATLPIADLGYGLSQILPVLAQLSFAPKGSTLLFEQPELHLHPGAARKLAEVFVQAISEKNLRIIAETHSIDFFLRLVGLLNSKKLSVENFVAYDVKREGGKSSYIRVPFVDAGDGHLEADHPWSKGLEA